MIILICSQLSLCRKTTRQRCLCDTKFIAQSGCDIRPLTVWKLFHPQYALPLIFIRTWSARSSRAGTAQQPRQLPRSRSMTWSVHSRGPAAHKARTGIGRFRRQPAVAFSPQPSSVRDRGRARDLSVPASSPCPWIVQARGQFTNRKRMIACESAIERTFRDLCVTQKP